MEFYSRRLDGNNIEFFVKYLQKVIILFKTHRVYFKYSRTITKYLTIQRITCITEIIKMGENENLTIHIIIQNVVIEEHI